MTWRESVRRIAAIAWKDLTAERRAKANVASVASLGALILLVFGFAIGPDAATLRLAAAGILWLAVLFSGILAFHRSYQLELEGGALEALLLYPAERWEIFVGKLLANLSVVLLVELVVIPLAVVFYQITIPGAWAALLGVVALGSLGFVTLGTFYAAMASRTRSRDVLLPLLLFPMLVPVLLAATEASTALLAGDPLGDAAAWIRLLAAFDAIFLIASLLVFEHIIEA
ncbi:MAG: heme exporter protein CcmB [Gemmatimonadaceae bacterium]